MSEKYELLELTEMGRIELENIIQNFGFTNLDKTRGEMIGLILEVQGNPVSRSKKG